MAVVVAAKHLQLRETVAVKLLHPHVLANPQAIARFLREARVAMRLRSDHVARVYDVGALDDRTPFVVMEHLNGDDLRALLRERGRFSVTDAVDYVLQACEAIAEAHGIGVVHRDLKPANLFLTTRVDGSPCVKVLDFGVSKTTIQFVDDDPSTVDPLDDTAPPSAPSGASLPRAASSTPPSLDATLESAAAKSTMREVPARAFRSGGLTLTQAFVGSPRYVAPEQILSARNADVRADVWALGVILHELVSGSPPFDGDTLEAVSRAILEQKPAPMRVPGARALEPVINRCLVKDRENRFQSVDALAEALSPLASDEGRVSAGRIIRMASVRSPFPSMPPVGAEGRLGARLVLSALARAARVVARRRRCARGACRDRRDRDDDARPALERPGPWSGRGGRGGGHANDARPLGSERSCRAALTPRRRRPGCEHACSRRERAVQATASVRHPSRGKLARTRGRPTRRATVARCSSNRR